MLPNTLKIVVTGIALISVANRAGAADEKIQEKMKVHNTAGIVVYAIKKGIYKI